MQVRQLDHFVLTARDIDTTVSFYTNVLGMEAVTFVGNRRALRFGQQKINLHQAGCEFEPHACEPTSGSAHCTGIRPHSPALQGVTLMLTSS